MQSNKSGWIKVMFVAMLALAAVPAAQAQRRIVLNQIIVLSDVSGSIEDANEVATVQKVTREFVAAMPEGSYESALSSYAGMPGAQWSTTHLRTHSPGAMSRAASGVKYLGGGTPLPQALTIEGLAYEGKTGKGAVLVISDGKFNLNDAQRAVRTVQNLHNGDVCVYTVHVGDDAMGASNLEYLTKTTGCGQSWTAGEVANSAGMTQMVDVIFYGGTPAPPRAATPAEPRRIDGDADGDGVPDSIDKCPDTPKGAKVDARGCWVLRGLNFDFDKSDIKPEFNTLLNEVATVINQNQGFKIRIDGHTDSSGAEDYNMALSLRRAAAVRDALVQRGVKAERLGVKGFGESQPSNPNDTDANRYENRRVELTVVQ
jgi:OOP family OmpA-OmpF porin